VLAVPYPPGSVIIWVPYRELMLFLSARAVQQVQVGFRGELILRITSDESRLL